jgi:hypothetical protein
VDSREFPQLFRRPEYRQATVIRLSTPAAAEAFLAELKRADTGIVANPPRASAGADLNPLHQDGSLVKVQKPSP